MQLKYNRQRSLGSSLTRILIKLILLVIVVIIGIFLIEKIKFPSPQNNYKIDITNEIKSLNRIIGILILIFFSSSVLSEEQIDIWNKEKKKNLKILNLLKVKNQKPNL